MNSSFLLNPKQELGHEVVPTSNLKLLSVRRTLFPIAVSRTASEQHPPTNTLHFREVTVKPEWGRLAAHRQPPASGVVAKANDARR